MRLLDQMIGGRDCVSVYDFCFFLSEKFVLTKKSQKKKADLFSIYGCVYDLCVCVCFFFNLFLFFYYE